MNRLAAAAALLCALPFAPLAARAAEWVVIPERSEVRFDYVVNDSPGEGSFSRFRGRGEFEPEHPEDSRLKLVIEIRSLWAGDPLTTSFMLHKDWFDAEDFPTATFDLTSMKEIRAEGAERFFRAFGQLQIRGVTREVRATLTLSAVDGEGRASGTAVFDPAEFGIGKGPSALFAKLGDHVRVNFDIVAEKADRKGPAK